MAYLANLTKSSVSATLGNYFYWSQRGSWAENGEDRSNIIRLWYEKGTSATLLFESQFQWLRMHYVFREDEVKVKRILREYPFLIQLLVDTYSRIEAYFPGSQVFLDVAIDYEAVENHAELMNNNEELVISISALLPPARAVELLKKFYSNWWSKVSRDAKGKISIGLEFL